MIGRKAKSFYPVRWQIAGFIVLFFRHQSRDFRFSNLTTIKFMMWSIFQYFVSALSIISNVIKYL